QHLQLTQSELARLIGVHPRTILRWEQGQSEVPSWYHDLLWRLGQARVGPDHEALIRQIAQGDAIAALGYLLSSSLPVRPLTAAPPALAPARPSPVPSPSVPASPPSRFGLLEPE